MRQKTALAALILGAATLVTPLAWAQGAQTQKQDRVHSTKALKESDIDRSDWISFKDALKKLDDEGHHEIISLTQTYRGYYARVINDEGHIEHIIIHPVEGTLSRQDASELRQRRHDRAYRGQGNRMQKGADYHRGHQMRRGEQRGPHKHMHQQGGQRGQQQRAPQN